MPKGLPLIEWCIVAAIILIIASFLILPPITSPRHPLMRECMADGHKQYQCVAMLRGRR